MNNAETKDGVQVTQRKEFWDFFLHQKRGIWLVDFHTKFLVILSIKSDIL